MLFVINPATGVHSPEEMTEMLHRAMARYPAYSDGSRYGIVVPESCEALRRALTTYLSREGAREEGLQTVVSVGGDGTILDCLSVLVNHPAVRLGIIPNGTGNRLAMNLGIPTDLEAALKVILEGAPKRLDVGRIGDGYYFALMAGAGVDAEIMAEVNPKHKKAIGVWAYVLEGIRRVFFTRQAVFRVTADDGRRVRARGIGVVVANAGNLLGNYFTLTPDARPDDGLLDVCILRAQNHVDYLALFLKVLTRSYGNDSKAIRHLKVRKVKIESFPALKVQADGNVIGRTPIEIEALPGKVEVMTPASPSRPAILLDETWSLLPETVQELLRVFLPGSPRK